MELKTKAKIIDYTGIITFSLFCFNFVVALFSSFSETFAIGIIKKIPFFLIEFELIFTMVCFLIFIFYKEGWNAWNEINRFN